MTSRTAAVAHVVTCLVLPEPAHAPVSRCSACWQRSGGSARFY